MPDGSTRVLTPLGLGSPPVLPIPGWSERVYTPHFLTKISDRVVFALSAVVVAYLLAWLIWIVSCWHHPVLRISDPLFSALSLVGLGCLASSNFVSTFNEDDTSCTASTCMFWFGLTLGFAPLVLKNLRIWSLWHNRSNTFATAPIKQWHLGLALLGLLLVDMAINTAWALDTGMQAAHVRPDPWRPALDYGDCLAFVNGRRYLAAHIAVKAVCLAAAMYLAYLLRNVSAAYSESRFIALAVYNVVVVLAVLLPLVTLDQTAGHQGTILVRNSLILFLCVSTASIMCVPKYLAVQAAEAKKEADIAAARERGVTMSSSDGGALTLPPPPKDGLPLKSALKPARVNPSALGDAAGIELQSVHDAHFQSGVGLSAVARPVHDIEASHNTNTQAPSSMLYQPHPPHLTTRPPAHGSARKEPPRSNATARPSEGGAGATNRAPLLPTIMASPMSFTTSVSHNSANSVSLLRAAYDLLESTSDDDLSTDELVRLHSTLGQRVARRMKSASSSSSQPQSQSAIPSSYQSNQTARRPPAQPQHPPQSYPSRQAPYSMAQQMASISSSGSSGSSSSFGTSSSFGGIGPSSGSTGSFLPDTLSHLPAPPSVKIGSSVPPVSSPLSATSDGSPGSSQPLLSPASHVVSIIPDPAAAAHAPSAAASSSASPRDRTPSSKKRTPSSKRVFRSDLFDTDIVSFHTE